MNPSPSPSQTIPPTPPDISSDALFRIIRIADDALQILHRISPANLAGLQLGTELEAITNHFGLDTSRFNLDRYMADDTY